jgi:2,3-dihydroxyethylbenzene 1,2-dioxygenase
VHANGNDDVEYLGFRVAGPEEFREMQQQLTKAEIPYRVGSEEEAVERHVLEVLKLSDPSGNPIEIFHGPEVQASKPFHPGRRMHGRFKTGSEGMGHCLIRADDISASYRFYTLLGMRGGNEYKLRLGQQVVAPVWMHCNDRDHTLAFGMPGMKRHLNHLMVEADNLNDVGLTHELVRRHKIPVDITLGRHSNDHMFTFYFRTPSGWMLEYGWGGRPATYQSEYYLEDMFGHHPEAGGFGVEIGPTGTTNG